MQMYIRNTLQKDIPIHTEVAASHLSRLWGLMFRFSLPKHRGMLFVFPREAHHSFWMLFTFIPLEAVFIAQGRIAEITPMPPHSVGPYASNTEVRYVLELPHGFCQRHRITKGCKVKFWELL